MAKKIYKESVLTALPATSDMKYLPGYKVKVKSGKRFKSYILDSNREWIFDQGITDTEQAKLTGLKTQEQIDRQIDTAVSQANGVPIQINGTVLPQGNNVPAVITVKGTANLYGLVGGTTYTQTGGTSITVTQDKFKIGYYDRVTNLWSASIQEYNLPIQDVSNKLDTGGYSGTAKTIDTKFGTMIGSVAVIVEGDPQLTTSDPSSTTGVSTVHGYSFPIGYIPLPFNKVTVPFAQNTATAITQMEIRLFENSPSGALIVKKRISFAAIGTTQAQVDFIFDNVIQNSQKIWCQILVNNPFSVKRVSPAVKFTAANGYATPSATTVNNLSGTVFATAQAAVDVLLTFNSVLDSVSEINFTEYGEDKIIDIIKNNTSTSVINEKLNVVGHSIWAQDAQVYNNTTDIAIGIQTLLFKHFTFKGYNKWTYSGRSLGATEVGDPASISTAFPVWIDESPAIWILDTITNDFKRDIPIGTIGDYNNDTGVLTYYGALRKFKDKANSLTPNAKVIAANALRRNRDGYTSTSINKVGASLLDYEKAIMTVSKLNKWKFVDQYRFSGITDETLGITTVDGLHPNDFGYSIYYKQWVEAIRLLSNEM